MDLGMEEMRETPTDNVPQMAASLKNRLALAKFKTRHGWEELTLDVLEPRIEEEIRRRRAAGEDVLSDSSSSAGELPYPSRGLMSSPLKAPLFSDAIGSSNGSTGHRKRTYTSSFDHPLSSPAKRFRASPTPLKSFGAAASWRNVGHLAQSSPIKPRRQQHFTTSNGPDVSFFQTEHEVVDDLTATLGASDDDDDLLPVHSFSVNKSSQASPPRTPPMRTRSLNNRKSKDKVGPNGKPGEEGADLLLYLAASPSPAVPSTRASTAMEPPKTPPPKNLALPSSMMTTPGGGNLFPNTPGQGFDFADFLKFTPSPAQRQWKTPVAGSARTPLSVARRRLTFDDAPF